MSEFEVLRAGAGGMARARTLLELGARNVAAAQASTPEHPYRRLVAEFAEEPDGDLARVRESGEAPDALTEMIAMLDAQRGYEASATIFDLGKRIAERTLEVGRP